MGFKIRSACLSLSGSQARGTEKDAQERMKGFKLLLLCLETELEPLCRNCKCHPCTATLVSIALKFIVLLDGSASP